MSPQVLRPRTRRLLDLSQERHRQRITRIKADGRRIAFLMGTAGITGPRPDLSKHGQESNQLWDRDDRSPWGEYRRDPVIWQGPATNLDKCA